MATLSTCCKALLLVGTVAIVMGCSDANFNGRSGKATGTKASKTPEIDVGGEPLGLPGSAPTPGAAPATAKNKVSGDQPAAPLFKADEPLNPEDSTALRQCYQNLGGDAKVLGNTVTVKVIGSGGNVEMQQYEDLSQTPAPVMVLVNIKSDKAGLAAHLALQNDNGYYCVHIAGGSESTVSLIEAACKAHIVSATVDSPNFAQGIVRTHGATAGAPGEPCLDASGAPVLPTLTQGITHP